MQYIEIDFESEEAIYRQICRQIVSAIAMNRLRDGDSLPSVRALAEEAGINMHTVNKSYSVLRSEGFLLMDRRKGAVISVDADRDGAEEFGDEIRTAVTKALCRGMDQGKMHEILDGILKEYQN